MVSIFLGQFSGQTRDDRPRKSIDFRDQVKLLKLDDQAARKIATAVSKGAEAEAAKEEALKAQQEVSHLQEELKKKYGCVDFDLSTDEVRCVVSADSAKPAK
jgi:hypothetical protein